MTNDTFKMDKCPMTRTMAILGSKWKPVIIYTVNKKHLRFGQLAAQMPLISRKVLTDQLKELEEDGILLREAYNELPPRVEYSLTEKGLALLPILQQMCEWNRQFEKHGEECTAR
ncbi:helix-turn-helix transcriptional regulator [Chitinophaga horti]|uniref:Helix-turn-helix transcriptional regulator n=1 Tax=Chitinophaga horti TaxID=2920382 RepID=A0ABY6IY82_9BACT|nr:helix-turn-helix domain-containing protein [Chitinophaga horti]UYQ92346.1 helix-turn-helix transcriptional regulator [Chitinophaga horti]